VSSGDGGDARLPVGRLRLGRGRYRSNLSVGRLLGGLFRGYLVDHLRQLGLAVLAVLLDPQLRSDLVQIAQALALQGAQLGHSIFLPVYECGDAAGLA
jgi:hypothetical protein